MLKTEAYLLENMVITDEQELKDVIYDAFIREGEPVPPVVRGYFIGYIGWGGWHIGKFISFDGRVYRVEVERVEAVAA